MATDVRNRIFTADVSLMSLAKETNAAAFGTFNVSENLIGVFTNAKIAFDTDSVVANVPTDLFNVDIQGFEFHIAQGYTWSIDLTTIMDGTLDLEAFLWSALGTIPAAGTVNGLAVAGEVHRGLVGVVFQRPGGTSGSTYQGLGWITKANLKISEGLQTQSATITNYGPLSIVGG